jgi:hypothetical protein
MHMPHLFLLLSGHPDQGQLTGMAIHVTAQALAKRGRIPSVGRQAGALLVELPRCDHVAGGSAFAQRSTSSKAEAARLIDHVDGVTFLQQPFHPRHELCRPEPSRRTQCRMIVLSDDNINAGVNVEPSLMTAGVSLVLVPAAVAAVATW